MKPSRRNTNEAAAREPAEIGPALLDKWALGYLERFASSAENLRRVLRRRVRRRTSDNETVQRAAAQIASVCQTV